MLQNYCPVDNYIGCQRLAGCRTRAIEIRHLEKTEDARECHIVFISHSEQPRLQEVLAKLRNSSVLSVSDIRDFSRRGGMIGFVMQDNKVRFELNAHAASQAGLKIDSKLKRVALTVQSTQSGEAQ